MTRSTTICSLAAAAALAFAGSQAARAQALLYGIGGTDTGAGPNASSYTLFNFNSNTPGTTNTVGVVNASAGYVVTSIAFQPTTGQLYGFQYNATTNQGQLVTINRFTAAVATVGSAFTIGSTLGSAGNSASISFNPSNGAIRLVTGTNGNFRISPTTGALLGQDANVFYAAGDPNVNNTFQIGTVAYSNNATLYDIDYINGYLTTQNISTNPGQLNSVGAVGLAFTQGAPSVGFTIGQNNAAFLNATDGTQGGAVRDNLYSVDLTSGATTLVGSIGGAANFNTADIAAFVPEPGTYALFTLGGAALLFVTARRRRVA